MASMDKRQRQTGRASSGDYDRHVRLHHWVMRTEAWRDLTAVARAAYVELSARYNGRNNGSIAMSVRELAKSLRISKTTAGRVLIELETHGFIVTMTKGAFSMKVRHASEYRLTEYGTLSDADVPELATKDFARWRAPSKQAA